VRITVKGDRRDLQHGKESKEDRKETKEGTGHQSSNGGYGYQRQALGEEQTWAEE